MYEVLGIEKGKSKKDNDFTVLHLVSEFDTYSQQKRGALGNKCESVYISLNLKVDVGQHIELVYKKGFNDIAVVSDIKILK